MEILQSDKNTFVVNSEVRMLLKENNNLDLPQLNDFRETTIQYLTQNGISNRQFTTLPKLITTLKGEEFKLSENEVVQILNLCPKTKSLLHLIIQDCDARYTPEQLSKILDVVSPLTLKNQQ